MNIAIIGGGFTGLTAAHELLKNGHTVTVFEKDAVLGGLAHGFQEKNWDWPLEFAYHHFFTNDDAILSLMKEIGMEQDIIIKRPITSTYLSNPTIKQSSNHQKSIYQLDSPLSLLRFDRLSVADRLRTGFMLALLKINPFWQPLEGMTAETFFKSVGGENAWKVIWEPLMKGKFGKYSSTVAASWLWARIKKRTTSLGYIRGGFQTLVNNLAETVRKQGGVIYTSCAITGIKKRPDSRFSIEIEKTPANKQQSNDKTIKQSHYDRILITTPTPIALKLISTISSSNQTIKQFSNQLKSIPHLHAQMLILETKEPILPVQYWLNINDPSYPFLAFVQHTNFIDRKHYGGSHIAYIGNYLPPHHPYLSLDKEAILKLFTPYLKKIKSHNSQQSYNLTIKQSYLFTGYFAQPVHELHYSKKAPKLETPIPNVYLANMDSVYPWDRGTNYAVELGKKAATHIRNSHVTDQ